VTTGEKRGDQVAILEGLKPGDYVVTVGQHKLREGARVLVNNSVKPDIQANPEVTDT
jgi:membrane fusion protein (multidrug efflux system)